MFESGMRPVHPGEVLRQDYLKPLGLSVNSLAKRLHVPPSRINDIVLERRGVSADTGLRVTRCFGGDAQTWLNLALLTWVNLIKWERGMDSPGSQAVEHNSKLSNQCKVPR